MSTRQGNLVRLYLYKAVWTLTFSGVGNYVLRVGGTNTPSFEVATASVADVQSALNTILGASNSVVTGTDTVSPYTITLAEDYLFSGVPFEVSSTTGTAAVTVARSLPASPETHSEGNGYYLMGAEYDLSKSMDLEIQDITNKTSSNWKESIGQVRSWTQNPSHYFLTDGYFSALYAQYKIAQPILICDISPSETSGTQDNYFGIYFPTNLSETSTQNQVVEFTATFELTGEPTEVTA